MLAIEDLIEGRQARPGALRRQPRPQHRRGRHHVRHRGRGDRGHGAGRAGDRAVADAGAIPRRRGRAASRRPRPSAPGIIAAPARGGLAGRRDHQHQLPDRPPERGRRGRGDPPGLPRRAQHVRREAHRPARPRLLLDGLHRTRRRGRRRGHRPARRADRAHLGDAAAHRPDPHADRSRPEGVAGRRRRRKLRASA